MNPNVYDCRGDYKLVQSNGAVVDLHVEFTLDPTNGRPFNVIALRGNARIGEGGRKVDISGRTERDQFFMVIPWHTGSIGEYHGTFNGGDVHARLSGTTFDQRSPGSQATWFIDGRDFNRVQT